MSDLGPADNVLLQLFRNTQAARELVVRTTAGTGVSPDEFAVLSSIGVLERVDLPRRRRPHRPEAEPRHDGADPRRRAAVRPGVRRGKPLGRRVVIRPAFGDLWLTRARVAGLAAPRRPS